MPWLGHCLTSWALPLRWTPYLTATAPGALVPGTLFLGVGGHGATLSPSCPRPDSPAYFMVFRCTAYLGQGCKVGHAPVFFVVLLIIQLNLAHWLVTFLFSAIMTELQEIPLDLQLWEAHRRIQAHRDKGPKFPQFLSPMFLWRFPTIMDNQLSIDLDTIYGIYDRMPFFPITLIDMEIMDDWAAHPSVWEVEPKKRHPWRVLTMVRYTLLACYKGQASIMFRASFVLIPSHQARTSLSDALSFLKSMTEDCVVLVSTPS